MKYPDFEQYLREDVSYVEVSDEIDLIEGYLEEGENLLQIGTQGLGKTLSFSYVGEKREIPVIIFACSQDTKRSEFIAKPWIEVSDGVQETVTIPGALPVGIEAANRYGEAILVLDEISVLPPKIQKNINEIGDWREEINIVETGSVVSLDEDANLLVGGTMNPVGGIGSAGYELNHDLRSRFGEIIREFDPDVLPEILSVNNVPDNIGDERDVHLQISSFIDNVYSHGTNGNIQYTPSPRDGVRLGRMWKRFYDRDPDETSALKKSLKTSILGKMRNDEEREYIRKESQKSFDVRV